MTMKILPAVRSLLRALCLACLTSALMEGQLHAAARIEANSRSGLGSGTGIQNATSGEVSSQHTGAFQDAAAHAHSRARFGVLTCYAESHIGNRGPNNISSVDAQGSALFVEAITINAPGRTGQNGTLTFKVDIHGSLAAAYRGVGPESIFTTRSYASTSFKVLTVNAGVRDDLERHYPDGTTTIGGLLFLNRLETIAVPFVYGTTFEMQVLLSASVNSRTEFGADCISDIGDTLEWGGIVSVSDSGSNPVTNYTMTTGSGTDYSAPILDTPILKLVVLSPGQLQLSWRTNYPAFTMESSIALSNDWQTVVNNPVLSGEQYTLAIDASTTSQFFRMRKN